MAERQAATKGRRMGSSRRKQLHESSGKAPATAPSPGEEPPWASEIVQRVQDFFREQDKDQAGFVTRSDMQKLQEADCPCSTEELELVFDGLDAANTGRLSTEEFTAGLCQFLSSQKAARDHRRRKTTSRRVRLVLPSPSLEGADSEEQRHFAAFMDQLGTDNVSEEQEIWQLWVKLRQDEPQLLVNLEDFLAKMRHRIQEARRKKEALGVTLNKRVAEHGKEVQQLCEALEQQIQQEQWQLKHESTAQCHQHGVELQRALEASEREVQRLVTAQRELEARCHSLRGTQQAASTENRQLEESNRVLEDHLQHLHQQLQQTHGRLRTARAALAREHPEEPGDRAAAELPGEMPMSPQMSLENSAKHHSKMQTRLGSQSGKLKAKSTHQVVWEVLPAEISPLGAPPRASSVEENPIPEFLKEERFSDRSSLLREMNDAIAALSKQSKPQALVAPPMQADTARHPRDDAEPQTGLEAAAARGTSPGVLQETLPGHIGHKLFEGDLKEGPAPAELRAPDVTQAGASTGAGPCRAQEPGAEQGESLEEVQGMFSLQGKGAAMKELMLKAAEGLQGAPGESTEAGEQVLMEVEGEGWMQETTGWEKSQPLGEAEEAALSQGENLEAGLGPPEAEQAGLAVGWQLATAELGQPAAPGEYAQPPGTGLGQEADPPSGLCERLEIKPGEHLEPEPPSRGETRVVAGQGDSVLPAVTVAPGLGMPEEERVGAEVQPWGETLDADVPPAQAQHGASSRAGAEEGEVEETHPREAEPQPQGESARGGAAWGGSEGAGVLLPAAVPPADGQEGGAGTDVQPLEAQSGDANVQLLREAEAALQPPSEAGCPGTEQGGSVAPGGQPQEEGDEPELGLGEERGAAVVHGEGPSPVETPTGSVDLCVLLPVKAQALELVDAEDSQAATQLYGGGSPVTPQGGEGGAAVHPMEEAEDGAQGQGECELPHELVLDLQGSGFGHGEGAGAGVQPWEGGEILGTLQDQSTDDNVQLLTEAVELKVTPGGSTEAALQLSSDPGSPGTEQGGSVVPDAQSLDLVNKLVEMVETEDSWADMQLHGGASPVTLQGRVDRAAMQLVEEAEDGAQGQGECELPHEPVLDLQGLGFRQGEEAGAGVQPWEGGEILGTLQDQSTGVNVQPLAEAVELKVTPGGSTEAALQPLREAGSPGTEQGGSVAPDVQPLDQIDKPESMEMVEVEESLGDRELRGGGRPETPQGGEDSAAVHPMEEAEDGAQGQGECELPHEPVLDLQGSGFGQGEGAGAGVQPWEGGKILGTLQDQSTDDNVQPLAEAVELKVTPGGSTEAALQLSSDPGSPGTEQGGSVVPDAQSLDLVNKLVEMVETEDSWADMQLHGGASPVTLQGRVDRAAMQLVEEAEDGAQGQGECELPHEPVLDPHEVTFRQGEGPGAGTKPPEEADSLGMLEDQSTGVNVQPLAEAVELKVTPGGSTEAALQPLREAGSPGTEQGGSVAPDVQPLDQIDKPESMEMVEVEESLGDRELRGGGRPETPQGGEDSAAVRLLEEAADGAQGQGECELPHEPVLDLQGSGFGQGEGAGAGVQPWEGGEILGTLQDQSTDDNVQLLAEAVELKVTPGGSTEAALQLSSDPGSPGTEQGGSVVPDAQSLDLVNKLVEMVETEDSWADMQLHGGASPVTLRERANRAAMQLVEEAEDGAQGQGECELLHEPVPDPHEVTFRQGEGPGAGTKPPEEADSLGMLEDQSTGVNVQLLTEAVELKVTPGGSTEAALQPLREAGSPGTEQGGSVAPDVQPLDQIDKPESMEMVEVEESLGDRELRGGGRPETPQGGEDSAAVHPMEEAADGAQGQGECELPHEPVLDLQGFRFRQGEGAGAGVQPWEGGEILGTLQDQSTDVNVQLVTEAVELKVTPGGSTEAALQLSNDPGSPGTEQGGSVVPDAQSLDLVDKLVEMVETEDSWADMQLHGGASPVTLQGRVDRAAMQLVEEAEDGAQGQGECELPHEPVLDLQGLGFRQGEGAGAGVQPWEGGEILGTLQDQSTDDNVQLLTEAVEHKLTPGGSAEAGLHPSSEAGYLGTEQGGSVVPDMQPLDVVDKLVEMEETEDLQADMQLHGGASPVTLQGRVDRAAMQLVEEAEDRAQGQGECELPHEPVLDLQGLGFRQGEGAGAGVQPWEGGEILGTLQDQSTDDNVQLLTEAVELKVTPGGSTKSALQPLSEAGSPGKGQGGSMAPDVQLLGLVGKPEKVKAEDVQADMQLHGGGSSETPQGWGDGAAIHLLEEAEDGAQGQGECELLHEPVPDPHEVTFRQGEGPGAGTKPPEEADSLGMLEDQSTGVNVQLLTEAVELKVTPGGSTEAALQPLREAGSPGTEQGGSVAPDVQPLDQIDKPESMEMVEVEESLGDRELRGGGRPETPQGGEDRAAVHPMEEAADGAQGQGECELPHEPVLDLQGLGFRQGEGAGAGVQPWEGGEILGTLQDQSTGVNVQPLAEVAELESPSGRRAETHVAPLGAVGMWKGEQSQSPGSEAGLCAAHTAGVGEGTAGAHVSPPPEATLHPVHAAEGPGLEAKLGALTGPDGQILEDTQIWEIPQRVRADAEERLLGGAQGLEVVRGERLEAGARILVEIQSLGIKQGRDDGASALVPPVSEVTLQISTLKLEAMMQEDVLVPDVQRLGASGQAAQSEPQEQVSAQADKMRLHTAPQQPEEKPPHVMETEQVAARPAEPPKQEVPPASTRVQQEEDGGKDQLGLVLGDCSLGAAANSSMQPQRQLLGEHSKDLNAGQREKKQEVGWKMSQEGKPSAGQPGAVTADGAGAAPRGSPEACLDPDHLYNVLFIGDSHVGKTSFLYRLHADTFNPHLTATVGLDYQVKNLVVDNKRFALRLWDSAGQERYRSITKQFFRKADGVVLMYDVTSECSFSDVQYWLSCIQEGAEDGVAVLLLGNKTDCAAQRQVPTEEGERLAKEHQLVFHECSAASGHNVSESMVSLIRLLKIREEELKNKAEEVPKPPQKKKGCCW